MNINAQNALLKTLEELPENKHIFIISNNANIFYQLYIVAQA